MVYSIDVHVCYRRLPSRGVMVFSAQNYPFHELSQVANYCYGLYAGMVKMVQAKLRSRETSPFNVARVNTGV